MKQKSMILLALIAALLSTGSDARAVNWTPGWTTQPEKGAIVVSASARPEAQRLGDAIDSPESARTAILAWERVTAAQPDDVDAWVELACLRLLEGAAYRQHSKERLACYIAGIQACERAMATNPEFLRRVQSGQTVAQASAALGPREMGAMHFWATGVFYIFRDCLGFFGRIANVRRMEEAKGMLVRMDAVDPTWEQSTSTFSWGIYYLAMPSSRGGDKVKARECFDRAVQLGINRTIPRWGRGKYFYVAMNETAASQADLAAVAAREIDELGGSRPWNRYLKIEASRLLAK